MDARALTFDDGTLLEELDWVHGLACRLMGDSNDADDLVQEAWLKARSTPAERFANRSRLRAWLAAVTRRLARDTRRARQRRARREERAAQSEILGSAADVVERSALLEGVLHAVRALDEPYRSTVLLRYMDGYGTAEVAAAMSVSEEVVRKRLSRALARLRGLLGSKWGGALPACLEDSLGPAQRGAPPRSLARRASLWTSLGLVLLALAGLRALSTPSSADRTPTISPVALDSTPAAGASERAAEPEPAPPIEVAATEDDDAEETTDTEVDPADDALADQPMVGDETGSMLRAGTED